MRFSEERIIVVEIKTIDNPGFDSSQLRTINLYEGKEVFYLGFSWVDLIWQAIADAIVRLGSNFRHPLLFRVQVIPYQEADTTTVDYSPPRRKRRRRRRPTD